MSEYKPHQDIFTPDILINELLDNITLKKGDVILEPSAGSGNMINTLLDRGDDLTITAVELQRQHMDSLIKRFKDRGGVTVKEVFDETDLFDVFFG